MSPLFILYLGRTAATGTPSLTLDSPSNGAAVSTVTPSLKFTGTTSTGNQDISYEVQLSNSNTIYTPTQVQTKASTPSSASTTNSVAFTSNVTVGNTIIVGTNDNNGALNSISLVSDSLGNSYQRVASCTDNSFVDGEVWVATVTTGGACTITVTASAAVNLGFIAAEYSGVSTVVPIDVSTGASSTTGTAMNSGNSLSTQYVNDLVIGVGVTNGNGSTTVTAGNGYGNLAQHADATTGIVVAIEDKTITSSAPQSAAMTVNTSGHWGMMVVALNASSWVPIITRTSTSGYAGFADVTNGADSDPYASGNQISFTPQSSAESSLVFTGATTDYVEIPDNDAFSQTTTGALTISFWMNPSTLAFPNVASDGANGGYADFLGKGNYGSPNTVEWTFRVYDNTGTRSGRISFYIFNSTAGIGVGSFFQDPLTVGAWTHVVGKLDSTNTYIYKNGVLRDTDLYSGTITPANTTAPLRFGSAFLDGFFEGSIKDVRIWNRGLSDGEVSSIYNGFPPLNGLVAAWSMSEGSGSTVTSNPGSFVGTLHGSTSFNSISDVLTSGNTYYWRVRQFVPTNNVNYYNTWSSTYSFIASNASTVPVPPLRIPNKNVGPMALRYNFRAPNLLQDNAIVTASVSVSQLAVNIAAAGGTQSVAAQVSAVVTQAHATVTATAGTQVVSTVNDAAVSQSAANIAATGGTQSVATIQNASIAQSAANVTASGGTQSIVTTQSATVSQVVASVTASGGTQSVAGVNDASITQVAANLTASGGTQDIGTVNIAAVTQTAATITATGGAQSVAATQIVVVSQLAANLTATGGTQSIATIQDVSISQSAASMTTSGGAQEIATSNYVSIDQSGASLTASGGTQLVYVSSNVIQVSTALTATGGTQAVFASSGAVSASIDQVGASLTANGGNQVITTSTGPLPPHKSPAMVFLTDGHMALRLASTVYLPL